MVEWIRLANVSEISVGAMKSFKVENREILLVNVNDSFFAIGNRCTHAGGDLSKGTLEGNVVTCPRHRTKFDVTTGKVISHPQVPLFHPKAKDEPLYDVKIENDSILVKIT